MLLRHGVAGLDSAATGRRTSPRVWLPSLVAGFGCFGIPSAIVAIIPASRGGRMMFEPSGYGAGGFLAGAVGGDLDEKPWAGGHADADVLVH